MRIQKNCTCKAYPFIHRAGGGKCHDDGSGCFCGSCGMPASPVRRDFGYGALEAWGNRFVHTDIQTVSECCEADLYADASLKTFYQD
ncbi:MAG TPA: hypothetical protein VJ652_15235 [Noviherbaspirillum sp.]|nr:hypothetical protein [Noviherbaspirillum sp.]